MANFPTIQATVLQRNAANAYICGPCGDYGKTMPIPCDSAIIGVDMWATAQNDAYFQGFKYSVGVQPTIQSQACFKLTNSITGDWYMVLGTVAAYSSACAACCTVSPAPTLVVSIKPDVASCQNTCTTDGINYDAFWAVQETLFGGKYVSRVLVGGGVVNQQTFATGSLSIAALVSYLNTNASAVGVWSNPSDQTIKVRTTSVKNICFIACVKTS